MRKFRAQGAQQVLPEYYRFVMLKEKGSEEIVISLLGNLINKIKY